jgi:hypothetical protein
LDDSESKESDVELRMREEAFSLLSRYGICDALPSTSAEMTLPSADSERLILAASLSLPEGVYGWGGSEMTHFPKYPEPQNKKRKSHEMAFDSGNKKD